MNLVILTQYFPPEMGAPQNRLFELAHGLKRLGWNISVVTALPNYPLGKIFPSYKGRFSKLDCVGGIETKRFWLYPSNSSKALPRIISMISFSITCMFSFSFIRSKKVDYILVESPPLTLAVSGWALSLLTGSKFILNISDLWPLSAKELGAIEDGRIYRGLARIEQFLYRRAFITSGQSEEIVHHIKPFTSSIVYLFRNGVDTARFVPGYNINPSTLKIVYAGLLGVAQGIVSICKQVDFAELGVEFHIYGAGSEKNALVAFLKDHPDRGISYCGMLSRDEIPKALQGYDATLVSLVKNIYGAVPSKIYEALAAGLPIFFSGEGEGAQIVRANAVGWVNAPDDLAALKTNLNRYFLMNEGERTALKRHCRSCAESHFDRNSQIIRFHELLVSKG